MTLSRAGRRVLAMVLVLVCGASALAQPVMIEEIVRQTPGGRLRGHLVTVDLRDPTVEIVVTAPPPAGSTYEATLTRTDTWRTNVGARVAINANTWLPLPSSRADLTGLAVSDGVVISPARQYLANPGDPALAFTVDRVARIDHILPGDTAGIHDAVAGIGPSAADGVPGTMLVTDGVNTGGTARVSPTTRDARTAAGVSRAGDRLYLLVLDFSADWSVGATLAEAAELLIAKGAWRAVNLDGGNNSSLAFLRDNGTVLTNRPKSGTMASVGNQLGVRINAPAVITDRVQRPIRGAWLRPTNLATFETTVAALAQAGLQDIFLETLYHGRDTGSGNSPDFPARFGFDFLDSAIIIAARYGVHLHAWCETGYLDFGFSPSPLLTANPGWIVDHRDPANTITGDLANQRFVNLGNPGVRTALNTYFAALAARYPGLHGIQADYHFYPLAPSGAAPWSFDAWGRSAYQAQFGVDPINEVNLAATSYPTRWLTFNRGNITEALVQLRQTSDGVTSSPVFSCVMFADWSAGQHISKMIDLPNWAALQAAEVYMHMAYFTSLTTVPGSNPPRNQAIDTDITRMLAAAPNRRVVTALANLTNATRPSVTVQLDTIRFRGIEEFVWFDAPTFINNPTQRIDLRNWLDGTATPLMGDVTATGSANGRDLVIDARDLAWFNTVYTGTPVARTAANDRCDLDRDGVIDADDAGLLRRQFGRYRFGDDGVVDARDLAFLQECYTAGTGSVPSILHLMDLNGDGRVDYADEFILNGYLTVPQPDDPDVNRDGRTDFEDLVRLNRAGTGPGAVAAGAVDVRRSGVIDADDTRALEATLRGVEAAGMAAGQN